MHVLRLGRIVPDIPDQLRGRDLVPAATGARARLHIPGLDRIAADAPVRLPVRARVIQQGVRVAVGELRQAGHAQGPIDEQSHAAADHHDRGPILALATVRPRQEGQHNPILRRRFHVHRALHLRVTVEVN
jgi:hypothetical protein